MERLPGDRPYRCPVLRSAAVYFGIVFGVGFMLGSVRVPFVVPWLGERSAELAEMPLMFIAIFLAAGYVVRRYGVSVTPRGWALVGVAALALLVCAELLLAVVHCQSGSRLRVCVPRHAARIRSDAVAAPWVRRQSLERSCRWGLTIRSSGAVAARLARTSAARQCHGGRRGSSRQHRSERFPGRRLRVLRRDAVREHIRIEGVNLKRCVEDRHRRSNPVPGA